MKNVIIKGIECPVLRLEVSTRGGGIEIDLSHFFEGVTMTAYQNYLGGWLLGAVTNDCNVRDWNNNPTLVEMAKELRETFHNLTNPNTEWESSTFEENQNRPISAY